MRVSDQSGRSLGGASRIVTPGEEGDGGTELVNIVAVDEVIPRDRQVSILQLDVEGFEESALAGAIRTIERCKPIIILENLPDEDWMRDHVMHLGYRIDRNVDANTILIPD
jgi:FkbM family methyltransferase